jgi:hypothetical protein
MSKTMVCNIPTIALALVLALAPLVAAQTGQQQAMPPKNLRSQERQRAPNMSTPNLSAGAFRPRKPSDRASPRVE